MKKPLRVLIFIALLATILSITAPLSFNVGLVPITLATFTIYLIGGVTKRFNGLLAVSLYVALGIIGLPVFANFQSGIGILLGPTGGFVIGYLPMVFTISLITSINKNKIYLYYIAMHAGTIICYAFGLGWFMIIMKASIGEAFMICVVPFIIFDLIKIGLAGTIAFILNKKANFEEKFNI